MHKGLVVSKFERDEQQPLVSSRWVAEGSVMVKGRGIWCIQAQEHVPSLVFCGVGAVTVLPRAPRTSDETLLQPLEVSKGPVARKPIPFSGTNLISWIFGGLWQDNYCIFYN